MYLSLLFSGQAVEVEHAPATPLPMLDETNAVSEHDISCVSSISKASSSNVSKLSSDDGKYYWHSYFAPVSALLLGAPLPLFDNLFPI